MDLVELNNSKTDQFINVSKYVMVVTLGIYLSDFISGIFHIICDHRKITSSTSNLDSTFKSGWKQLVYSFQYSHHACLHDIIYEGIHPLLPGGRSG